MLQTIKSPLYRVPGNHDYWANVDFKLIAAAFAKTGGRWLLDESISAAADQIAIAGLTCKKPLPLELSATQKNIVLLTTPGIGWID